MPAILRTYLALAGGAAAAFVVAARGTLIAIALAVCCAAVALACVSRALGARVHRRWTRAAVVAGCAALGLLAAARCVAADAACRATLVERGAFAGVILADARPGDRARVRITAPCAARASLHVASGAARAGAHVDVRGIAWPTPRGVRVPAATITSGTETDHLVRTRARVGALLDTLFGPRDAPLARALVIADEDEIPDEIRDAYANAGLVHALSVSGLHVAIVAGALTLLLQAAGVRGAAAAVASSACVVVYVLLIGAPAPAVRAAVMLATGAASRLTQRPTSPWTAFAMGGLVPLGDPRVVVDLGYQLSMAGMAALIASRALGRRWTRGARTAARPVPYTRPPAPLSSAARTWARATGNARVPWRVTLASELLVGTIATLATAPLVAWHFGRISLVGVAANIAAEPVLALLQPALFLTVVAAPIRPVATLFADGTRPLLRALTAIAEHLGALPGATLAIAPTLAGAACACVAAAALLVRASTRGLRRGRAVVCGTAALAGATVLSARSGGSGELELHVLDVGQGDAIALRTPHGRWILFDAGPGGLGVDAGAHVVVPYVRRLGGPVAAVVLSHPHADHVGGAPSVIRRLHPATVWDGGFALGSRTYADVLAATRDAGATWHRVHPDDVLTIDGVRLRALAPDSAWTAGLDDPNLSSVVVRVEYGTVRFLLTGDAEAPEEDWLVRRAATGDPDASLTADVLKVAHHGSATSSTAAFVDAVHPRVALVSVGAANMYGHPSPDVIQRLRAAGADVRRTDAEGTIVVSTDGRAIDVRSGTP
ncbi:MAG TPA: DNA internalization-related competence protein ComEC/Rec2 [Gemmatirosa sp.]